MIYAIEKIYNPLFGVDEVILPPNPWEWIRPQYGEAAAVEIVGAEPTEELKALAEVWGWKWSEVMRKFYPCSEE
jgi:hypothetical protein